MIRPRIDAAVDGAMQRIGDGLAEEIGRQATERVYAYPATAWAMSRRRYAIGGKENMNVLPGHYEVQVTNETVMQGGIPNEATMVEEGWANYRQPGPRPFMDEARDAYVDSGKGDRELAEALRAAGFEVL